MTLTVPEELGKLLKSRRLELGLKQKDLEDDVISSSTISNVERGIGRISERKLKHLCEKLGWKLEELPMYLEQSKQKKEDQSLELALQLKAIENNIDCVSPQDALHALRHLPIAPDDPRQALIHFLKAKCYFKKRHWEKAEVHYEQAIRLCKTPEMAATNIISASYHGLGRIFFRQNDAHRALEAVEQGLSSYHPDGERSFIKYHLLISKVIYLEKLERYAEATLILEEEMWPHLAEIDTEVQLNMYELHATLLNKQNIPEKAIPYAEKGIEIARRVKNYDLCFELWTTLGSSYKQMRQVILARTCFETALKFESKVNKKWITAYNYTQLGLLFLMEGHPELAEEHLQKAVRISKKTNDGFRQYEANFALGKLYWQQKQEKEAITHLEMAREIAETHGLLRQERDAVIQLIQCYENRDLFKYQKLFARLYAISVQLLHGRDENMATNLFQNLRKSAGDPPDD